MENTFLNLFCEVFDENNNVRNCGRTKSKELIELANSLEPEVSHGNLETGFMKTKEIISLKEKLLK